MSIVNCDYFEFEGKRYPMGTVVTIKEPYDERWGYKGKQTIVMEHKIIDGKDRYHTFYSYGQYHNVITKTNGFPPEKWIKEIIPPEKVEVFIKEKPVRYDKDSENGEVMFGWMVYILIMIGLFIFKDRIMGWIMVSLIFYCWRKDKLRRKW